MGSRQNSNPSKLLWLSLLPVRMKKINPKIKVLEWSQHFSHYKYMGIFSQCSGAANSSVPGPILPNNEPIQDFMVVLVTCKNIDKSIKNEGASRHKIFHIITLWELSVAISDLILPKT